MESIFTQTVPTDDFVLVCDGPLNEGLEAVIAEMISKFGGLLHVIRIPQNMGLGRALNVGMRHCKNDLVARMDSDDISYPDRCERQMRMFRQHPKLSICSGIVEEFDSDPSQVTARRIPPETHEEILSYAKKRSPFNHPCVMYRRSAVEAAGEYQDFYLLEDYYLWLRMLLSGSRGYNIQEPLLWMRAGSEMYQRRSGWKYAQSQCALFRFMKEHSVIGAFSCLESCLIRTFLSLAPNGLRRAFYRLRLRK